MNNNEKVVEMKHLGTKTIETERLILRKFVLNDAEIMYKNWTNDDEVTKYLTWPTHSNVEITKAIVSQWEEAYNIKSNYQWCIELREKKEAIGSISVVRINEDVNSLEIGYCIGKAYWKQGILTEAFLAVIRYLFEEVQANRIVARHDINNPASGKVMTKCGLSFEGICRQADKNNTGICDIAIYGILKDGWNKLCN